MQNDGRILQNQDKSFVTFLWLLSLVSLYYNYRNVAFVQQIPFGKGLVGVMMMASEILLIVLAVRAYKEYYVVLHPVVRILILLTIAYNTAHIVYAAIWERDVAYLSLFGNPNYQPIFMLPIAFLIGLKSDLFSTIYKCVWYYVLLLVPIYILTGYVEPLAGMGILFLLAFAAYLPRKRRLFLIGLAVLYIVYSYLVDARACAIRGLMGGAILFYSYIPLLYKSKILKVVIFIVSIALPLYFLMVFVTTGNSVFEEAMTISYLENVEEEHVADTRTFLYEEVFEDLTENNAWIYGKGINGTYYSSFFDHKDALENRFGAEVGLLYSLLKGGIIQAVLYLLLLIWAAYRCIILSDQKYIILLGLVLLAHYVLLFIEEVPHYDLYSIVMWCYVGVACSVSHEEQDEEWCEEQFNLMFTKR